MIKAIIFDYDDTLSLVSEKTFQEICGLAKRFGWQAPAKEEYFAQFGKPLKEILENVWPEKKDQEFERLIKELDQLRERESYSLVKGAKKLLQKLKSQGFILAILSSSRRDSLFRKAKRSGLDLSLFEFIYTEEDVFAHKPDPAVFNKALADLEKRGIKEQEILYVGDLLLDYLPAKKAGINFVAVTTGRDKREDFIKAGLSKEKILDSVADLWKIL